MVEESYTKEETCNINFLNVTISKYLEENSKTFLFRPIFIAISKTVDINDWCQQKYVAVNVLLVENFHYTTCEAYRIEPLPG